MTRRELLAGAGAAGLATAAALALSPRHAAGAVGRPPGPTFTDTIAARRAAQPDGVFRVDVHEPIVALSFDDGPDPHYTPHVLDLLAAHDVRATFCLVGVNALRAPDLVARQRAEGHTFANHTYDHPDLQQLDAAAVRAEIERGGLALRDAGTGPLHLFRPPKGHTDAAVGAAADAAGYTTIFWDVCLERWIDPLGVVEGTRAALAHVHPGSIIVCHDGGHVAAPHHPHLDRSKTMDALPLLLTGLRGKGLRIVDVPTLLRAAVPARPARDHR
jgi:peptidoglycan/xylan/chitin deacetylase (PgdA/CDA1 family)